MATTSIDTLIAQARRKASAEAWNGVTNAEIVDYINEGDKNLRELIVSADDSYYQESLPFTLGAQPSNLQALPADFWKMRGLDAHADTPRQFPVYAREFRERHKPGGLGYMFSGDGNSIAVVPGFAAQSGNPYKLMYLPKPVPLAQKVTRSIPWTDGDSFTFDGTFQIANGDFLNQAAVGGVLTVAGSGDPDYDGSFPITEIVDGVNIITTPEPPGPFSYPLTTTFSLTYQPTGTRNSLDVTEDNFSEYLSVRAAIEIARKKRQDSLVGTLQQQLGGITERVARMSTMRQSEPQQAPVLQGRYWDSARLGWYNTIDDLGDL